MAPSAYLGHLNPRHGSAHRDRARRARDVAVEGAGEGDDPERLPRGGSVAGTSATSLQELANAAGLISNQVDANKFDVRAKGLAQEILNQNPDLVGIQEGALWRQAPCSDNPLDLTATQVRPAGNFLGLLLNELNKTAALSPGDL